MYNLWCCEFDRCWLHNVRVNTCQTHNIRDYTYMTTEAPVSHYIMESTPVNFKTLEIIQTWQPRLPYHITLWSQHLSNSQHQSLYIHDHRGSRITLYYGVNTSQIHNLRNHTNMTTEAPVSHYIMESTPVKITTSEIILGGHVCIISDVVSLTGVDTII
jgi:hypothetical protein